MTNTTTDTGELFVYNNNLYFIAYPLAHNEPKILMPDVVSYEKIGTPIISDRLYNIYILFKDGTIYCESTGKEYYLKNAFKISICNNKLLAIAPHKILYVMFDTEIQFYSRYWGLITDGEAGSDQYEHYILIIDGRVHYAGTGRMKIKPPYELLQFDYNTKIYKNGFSCCEVFYKTQVPPRKVFYITRERCMALINNGLYYFKTLDGIFAIAVYDKIK
ncbi:MAG: hypothetical protein ACUVRK_13630, partial [Spirochaetota bacterium]